MDRYLTQEIKESIAYMGDEERLAYDVYTTLYAYHAEAGTPLPQLTNIATRSEAKHIEIVESLVQRYDLVDSNSSSSHTTGVYSTVAIQNLYDTLAEKGKKSVQDALEVGCMVEVTDIADLQRDLLLSEDANASDITAAFETLRDGSYKHYWAFDRGLKNMGVSEGCCSLGDAYCHDEYPKYEHN